jgi:phytanoyl-CoA hydroxylase
MAETATQAGLTPTQLADFQRDGYLVIEHFWDAATTTTVKGATDELLSSFAPPETASVFTTEEQERTADSYFLTSGDAVRFFFEKGALDADGRLLVPKEVGVNKIGHNLHELLPAFRAVSLECPRVTAICRSLGFAGCVVPQSMAILKPPRIGGPVLPHVDGAFLYTRPQTVVGLWWPLEDCTLTNGCLWAVPGSHANGVARRFKRTADGLATEFEPREEAPLSVEGAVPLLTPAGSLVILHNAVVHFSHANTSEISRYAYSIHVVDDTAEWPADNWLQRPTPFPKLF